MIESTTQSTVGVLLNMSIYEVMDGIRAGGIEMRAHIYVYYEYQLAKRYVHVDREYTVKTLPAGLGRSMIHLVLVWTGGRGVDKRSGF